MGYGGMRGERLVTVMPVYQRMTAAASNQPAIDGKRGHSGDDE